MADLEKLSDEALVREVLDGNPGALETLTARYTAKMWARIQARLLPSMRRRVGASDVLQEAYAGAVERLPDFEDRGEGSFGRWFGAIVERKIRDAIRRHAGAGKRSVGQEVTRSGRSPTQAFAGQGPSPSQVAVGEEFKEAVRRALLHLPPDHRRVLGLLQDQGLSIAEAAVQMGRSDAAVKKLYGRALARLEASLELDAAGDHGRRRPTR